MFDEDCRSESFEAAGGLSPDQLEVLERKRRSVVEAPASPAEPVRPVLRMVGAERARLSRGAV